MDKLKPFITIAIITFFCLFSFQVFAAQVPFEQQPLPNLEEKQDQLPELPSFGALLLKMLVAMFLIIGLVLIFMKLLQRLNTSTRGGQGKYIKVVDQMAIGPNRGIVLVNIAGKVYALGVTDHGITNLGEVNADEIDTGDFEEQGLYLGERNMMGPVLQKIGQWRDRLFRTSGGQVDSEFLQELQAYRTKLSQLKVENPNRVKEKDGGTKYDQSV